MPLCSEDDWENISQDNVKTLQPGDCLRVEEGFYLDEDGTSERINRWNRLEGDYLARFLARGGKVIEKGSIVTVKELDIEDADIVTGKQIGRAHV